MKKRPYKRTFNVRRIKVNASYTYEEVADLLGVHKNTLLHWEDEGLRVMKDARPYLVHGGDLIDFISRRQKARKKPCPPNYFYCCKCQSPMSSYEGLVDIRILTPIKLQLIGLCSICNTKMLKLGSARKLPEYKKTFVVQVIHDEHLIGTTQPTAICD